MGPEETLALLPSVLHEAGNNTAVKCWGFPSFSCFYVIFFFFNRPMAWQTSCLLSFGGRAGKSSEILAMGKH